MIGKVLLENAIALLVYMSIWFFIAKKLKRLDVVDAAWGSGFALVAWVSVLLTPSGHSLLIAVLVTIWSARLTKHIGQRLKRRHDPRYEEISSKWKGNYWLRAFYSVYLTQGVLVWVISLPVMIAAGPMRDVTAIGFFAAAGTLIWLAGFITEAVADKQLRNFIVLDVNKGKVMDQGLWAHSRHPNYFGELVLWYGIAIFGFASQYFFWGLVGPIVLSLTIIFISGIPPIERRKKDDKAYQEYAKHTSPLVPLPRFK